MAYSMTQSVWPFQICQCLIKRREIIPDYEEERDKTTVQRAVFKISIKDSWHGQQSGAGQEEGDKWELNGNGKNTIKIK